MFYTYVLENNLGNVYIGQTNDVSLRLIRHNKNRVKSTKNKGPWKVIFQKEFLTRKESVGYEFYLKSLKSSEYIKKEIIR